MDPSQPDPRVLELKQVLGEIHGSFAAGEAAIGYTVQEVIAFEDNGLIVDMTNGGLYPIVSVSALYVKLVLHNSDLERGVSFLSGVIDKIRADHPAIVEAAWAAVTGEVHHG